MSESLSGKRPFAIVSKDGNVISADVLDRYALKQGEESKALPADTFGQEYGGDTGLVEPLYNIEALARLVEVNPFHYRCCKTKARDVAGLGYELRPSDSTSGEKDDTPEENAQYNLAMSFLDAQWPPVTMVLEKSLMDFESTGNGAIELVRDGDQPEAAFTYMGHLPVHTMRLSKDGKRACQMRGTRKVWFKLVGVDGILNKETGMFSDDTPEDKRASEVMWLANYTSRSDYYGVPDILPALGAVQGHVAQRDYNLKFFENFGVPAYAVYISGDYDLGDQDEDGEFELIKTVKKYFTDLQKEPHSTLIFAVPSAGGEQVQVEIKPLAIDIKEGSFRLFRKDNRDEILSVHGVPAYRAGIVEEGSLGGSSAKESTQIYKDSVIKPRQELIESHMNQFVLPSLGVEEWEFRLIEVDTTDEAHDLAILKGIFEMGGASPNDIIRYFGRRFGIEPVDHPMMNAYFVKGQPITDDDTGWDDPESIEVVKAYQSRLTSALEKASKAARGKAN